MQIYWTPVTKFMMSLFTWHKLLPSALPVGRRLLQIDFMLCFTSSTLAHGFHALNTPGLKGIRRDYLHCEELRYAFVHAAMENKI